MEGSRLLLEAEGLYTVRSPVVPQPSSSDSCGNMCKHFNVQVTTQATASEACTPRRVQQHLLLILHLQHIPQNSTNIFLVQCALFMNSHQNDLCTLCLNQLVTRTAPSKCNNDDLSIGWRMYLDDIYYRDSRLEGITHVSAACCFRCCQCCFPSSASFIPGPKPSLFLNDHLQPILED